MKKPVKSSGPKTQIEKKRSAVKRIDTNRIDKGLFRILPILTLTVVIVLGFESCVNVKNAEAAQLVCDQALKVQTKPVVERSLVPRTALTQEFVVSKTNLLNFSELKVKGRSVAYAENIFDPEAPVLILLPGVFRGYLSDDPAIAELIERKINHVVIHYSSHGLSQSINIKSDRQTEISIKDYADETEAVIEHLNIKNPYYASLSFSSAVTMSFPTGKNVIIEGAPYGAFSDGMEQAAQIDNAMSMANIFNPWAQMVYQQAREVAFKNYWASALQGFRAIYPPLKDTAIYAKAVDAYVAMAKSVEKYNLDEQDFKKGPEKVFLIAEHEDAARFKKQIMAIKLYKEARGEWPGIYMFQGSGHTIPFDVPKGYVNVVAQIMNGEMNTKGFVTIVHSDGRTVVLDKKHSMDFVNDLFKDL